MSDVIHHARPTATQSSVNNRRLQFRADIRARAAAFMPAPTIIPQIEPGPIPRKVWLSSDDLAFGPIVLPGAVDVVLPTCAEIVRVTAKHFAIPRVEMLSARRQADLSMARQIAMYLCTTLTLRSLPFIGRVVGDRDHTTVISSVRKIQGEICAGNAAVITAVDTLTAQLGGA